MVQVTSGFHQFWCLFKISQPENELKKSTQNAFDDKMQSRYVDPYGFRAERFAPAGFKTVMFHAYPLVICHIAMEHGRRNS